jgi:hypothetical protein
MHPDDVPQDQPVYLDEDVIGAIRLALVAGADIRASFLLVQELVERATPTKPDNTRATKLLIDAIQKLDMTVQAAGEGTA